MSLKLAGKQKNVGYCDKFNSYNYLKAKFTLKMFCGYF